MSTLLERIRAERNRLEEKTNKLEDFLISPSFVNVSEIQKVLLVTQFNLMRMYLYTLQERIHDLVKNSETED
jgi:hypothetical protein